MENIAQEYLFPQLATPAKAKPVEKKAVRKVEAKKPEPAKEVVEEPERKVSRLAKRTEELAVEKQLTESLGDLPTYETMKMADQAKIITDIINNDYEGGVKMLTGQKTPPSNLRLGGLYVAISQEATKRGDVETLRDIAIVNPRVSLELTALGQEIKAADYGRRALADPVRAMQDIKKKKEAAVKKRKKIKSISRETSRMTKEMKSVIRETTTRRQNWTEFVNSIRC